MDVTDEAAVPADFKTLVLKVPAAVWEQLLDGLDVDERADVVAQVRTVEVKADKRSIRAAIESGARVPGADVVLGGTR